LPGAPVVHPDLLGPPGCGDAIFALAATIFPICRSITGNGVRQTLDALSTRIPVVIHEVPSGTTVLDWTVPAEWNIRDAYIKNARGERIVDFRKSNLHVMSYSVPVHRHMTLAELKPHLHTLPDRPDWIPYRTSYYDENWAFCITERQLQSLPDEVYEVVIDSTLQAGHLTYGEYLHRGDSDEEFLLSAHICHPSLANDNCSGLALLAYLAAAISKTRTRYSYRFLFAPGTIGAITWLARNEERASHIHHGLILSMLGDSAGPCYKKSRRGDALIDRAMAHVLRHCGLPATIEEFSPYGYDERQYCSPGFNLPVGLLQRSKYGSIPQYHSSADDLSFIQPAHLEASCRILAGVIGVIEGERKFRNRIAKGEPQLGRRGLYDAIGGDAGAAAARMAMLWVLNLSDGTHSLLDIASRSGLPFEPVRRAAGLLLQHELLEAID